MKGHLAIQRTGTLSKERTFSYSKITGPWILKGHLAVQRTGTVSKERTFSQSMNSDHEKGKDI